MRWILCGKNDAAVSALEHLVAQGDEVYVLGVRADDAQDGWQRSLARAAQRLGARFERPESIRAPELAERLAGFRARALISIQYDQILRGPLLRALGCPALNLHFSLLPRHRGVSPIAWAIGSGDAEAGVTLHHLVEAIDAGDIVAQLRLPIGPAETARELYDRMSRAAQELFRASYPFPDSLLAARAPQDAVAALYHRAGDLDFSQRAADWGRPAPELQRWLRALIFPPFQYPETRWAGRVLRIARVGAALGPPVDAEPGRIVERAAAGLRVACKDGSLWIEELLDAASPQLDSRELLDSLRVGSALA